MGAGEEEPIARAWERFIKDECRERVNEALQQETHRRSIVVRFDDIQRSDAALADFILDRPFEAFELAQAALQLVDTPLGTPQGVAVRVVGLPDTHRLNVSDIRIEHAGKLVSVGGVVQAVSPVVPRLRSALYLCMRCGAALVVPQDEHLVRQEPLDCYEDQGGCGRDTKFKLVVGTHRGKRSDFIDNQVVVLQEPPESVLGTRPPGRLNAFVEGGLCATVLPSDRVRLVAVVRTADRYNGRAKSTLMDYFLDVVAIEREARDYDEIDPTPEEVAQFRELAASDELIDKLVGSVAPSIHGRREVKIAILMQLFGGVPKKMPDGSHKRGDIHVLLAGDPGVAKSMLGGAAVRLSPRGNFVNAITASVAGMVGGVSKAEKGHIGEGWVFEAGTVSMSHRGFIYYDEADKTRDDELLGALLVPLEQQVASINKQGARGLNVPCEFALLAGANPEGGRFDPRSDLLPQIKLPRPFLDRMDLAFVMLDTPNEESDGRLVDSMLRSHRAGGAAARRSVGEGTDGDEADVDAIKPALDPVFLRKYVAFAKRTVFPRLTPDVEARIKAKFTQQRKQRMSDPDLPVGYSARTIDSLVRLAEAAARMRLASQTDVQDIDLAFDIYAAGWERLATNARGQIDTDRIGSATPQDMKTAMKWFKDIIRELTETAPGGVPGDQLVGAAIARGISREHATGALKMWATNGTLMKSSTGYVLVEARRSSTKQPASEGDDRKVRWS